MKQLILSIAAILYFGLQAVAQNTDNRKAAVIEFYKVFDSGKISALKHIMSESVIDHDASHPGNNYKAFESLIEMVNTGFNNVNHNLEQIHLIGEDMIMVRWEMIAKHTGNFMGMSATGKDIAFNGHDIFKFKDGLIVEAWHVEELLGFIEQISPEQSKQ